MRRAALFLLIALAGCGRGREESQGVATDMAAQAPPSVASAPPPPPPQSEEGRVGGRMPPASPSPQRMIIRTATLSAIVGNADETLRKISTVVESRGGYIAATNRWRENEQVRATATIRVPEKDLNSVLAQIRALAIRVENESISGQDVSEEYIDLAARLTNLEATEKELRELLGTIRARTQKASEVMEVYRHITEVRGQIEQIKGRLRYLEQMTALATVNLELVPDVLAKPVVEPGWQPVAVFREASRALVATLKFVAEAVIWLLVYLLPIALVFVALVMLVRRMVRRRRAVAPSE